MEPIRKCVDCKQEILLGQGGWVSVHKEIPRNTPNEDYWKMLLDQSGYRANPAYGTGGVWSPPLLRHIVCPESLDHI